MKEVPGFGSILKLALVVGALAIVVRMLVRGPGSGKGSRPVSNVFDRVTAVFCQDPGLKAISFLIAVTIWFKVSFTNPTGITRVYHRPVRVINKDPSLVLTHPYESREVAVVVTGRRIDLLQVESGLGCVIDLKNVKSPIGEVTLRLEPVIPENLDLRARVEPAVVRVWVRAAGPAIPSPPGPPRARGEDPRREPGSE